MGSCVAVVVVQPESSRGSLLIKILIYRSGEGKDNSIRSDLIRWLLGAKRSRKSPPRDENRDWIPAEFIFLLPFVHRTWCLIYNIWHTSTSSSQCLQFLLYNPKHTTIKRESDCLPSATLNSYMCCSLLVVLRWFFRWKREMNDLRLKIREILNTFPKTRISCRQRSLCLLLALSHSRAFYHHPSPISLRLMHWLPACLHPRMPLLELEKDSGRNNMDVTFAIIYKVCLE